MQESARGKGIEQRAESGKENPEQGLLRFLINFTLQRTPKKLYSDLMKRLLSEKQIQARIGALARRINRDYSGREIILVGVLKGAFIFLADLSRRIKSPVKIDFVQAASYGTRDLLFRQGQVDQGTGAFPEGQRRGYRRRYHRHRRHLEVFAPVFAGPPAPDL